MYSRVIKVTIFTSLFFLFFVSRFSFAADLGEGYGMQCFEKVETQIIKCPKGHGGCEAGQIKSPQPITFTGSCPAEGGCHIALSYQNRLAKISHFTTFDSALNDRYKFDGNNTNLKECRQKDGTYKTCFPDNITPNNFRSGSSKSSGSIMGGKSEVAYSFYLVYPKDSKTTFNATGGGDGEFENGVDSGLQMGSFSFVFEPTPKPGSKPSKNTKVCSTFYWDPYGRVFDSVSLEPLGVNEATVTLYDENGLRVNTPSNGSLIDNLGKYNIYLENDGNYTLKVTNMTTNEFVPLTLDPKYTAYYEDVYIAGDPAFYESETDPKRIDIPVKPIGTPYTRPVETVSQDQVKITNTDGLDYVKYFVRASHPLSKISSNLDGFYTCNETDTDNTDKEGNCSIEVPVADVPPEGVSITLSKNPDYYTVTSKPSFVAQFINTISTLFVPQAEAQNPSQVTGNNVASFAPILGHIEGYAYNGTAKIPNATVEVRYVMNNAVYYTTQANATGFFTINKANLPPVEYYLQFIDQNKQVIKQTTAEFVKNNKDYILSQNLNLMAATKDEEPITPSPVAKTLNSTGRVLNNTTGETAQRKPTSINATNGNGISSPNPLYQQIILITLILLVGIGGAIALALSMKKQNTSQY